MKKILSSVYYLVNCCCNWFWLFLSISLFSIYFLNKVFLLATTQAINKRYRRIPLCISHVFISMALYLNLMQLSLPYHLDFQVIFSCYPYQFFSPCLHHNQQDFPVEARAFVAFTCGKRFLRKRRFKAGLNLGPSVDEIWSCSHPKIMLPLKKFAYACIF